MVLPPAIRPDFHSLFSRLLCSRADSTAKKYLIYKQVFTVVTGLGKLRYSCRFLLLLSPFIYLD